MIISVLDSYQGIAALSLLNMKLVTTYLLIAICGVLPASSQSAPPAKVQFAGCYEVRTLTWNPPDHSIRSIPSHFQLSTDRAQPGHEIFEVHSVPPGPGNSIVESWFWRPKRNEVLVSFGDGMGSFRGTLKPSNGDLVGKLKEWCDARCEWKKRVGTLRVGKIECPK